ncbi:MAG: hypothetical protein HC880_15695 [Bacteroidia bacterium]|nr:hypothetical protein [Bacteroidia bacterium]
MGGPKDTLSPFVVRSIPPNQSTNFRGELFIVEFNEWVRAEKLRQELIITPPNTQYSHKTLKNRLEIKFEDPLLENTTYSFNFRKAVEDITEGNVAVMDTLDYDALKIAFSTGDVIDSMSVGGQVLGLLNNKPIVGALVSLYNQEDTLQYNQDKPYYFTLTDENGFFNMENIAAGSYNIYAFLDKNNDLIYQEPEAVGFQVEPLVFSDTLTAIGGVNLKIASEDHTPPEVLRDRPIGTYYEIGMSEPLTSLSVAADINPQNWAYDLINKASTIRLYNLEAGYDTIPFRITAEDTVGNVLEDTVDVAFRPPNERERDRVAPEAFRIDIRSPGQAGIQPQVRLEFAFSKPVARYDFSQVRYLPDGDSSRISQLLHEDSLDQYNWNDARSLLSIRRNLNLKEELRILVDSLAFFSIEQDTLPATTTKFEPKNRSEFGSIYGQVTTTEKSFIIQLLDQSGKVIAEQRNPQQFDFAYLPAAPIPPG